MPDPISGATQRVPELLLFALPLAVSTWIRFSIAARSASKVAARSSCSCCAVRNAACALATSLSRSNRSFSLAASSLRRSASRRLCSRSNSAAALRASFIADLRGGVLPVLPTLLMSARSSCTRSRSNGPEAPWVSDLHPVRDATKPASYPRRLNQAIEVTRVDARMKSELVEGKALRRSWCLQGR